MKRFQYFILILIIFSSVLLHAQTKRALIIAIGDYPEHSDPNTSWNDLSSINDYEIVNKMLLNQGFNPENIFSLIDSQATSRALDEKFSELLSNCQPGDMIYFHFSGHGQQVTDTDYESFSISDYESDGYDESLVMYSAPKTCSEDYDLSEHYIDDRLNYWITEIRKKIDNGHVIMVLDACHSGTASRGGQELDNKLSSLVRGTKDVLCDTGKITIDYKKKDPNLKGFGLDILLEQDGLSEIVIFSGCKSDEINCEYRLEKDIKYGSLSYAFVKGIENLSSSNSTYYDLFTYINEFVEVNINQSRQSIRYRHRQHPQMEPFEAKSLNIFNGEFTPSDPVYDILSTQENWEWDSIQINAGSINSKVKLGDKVSFRLISNKDKLNLEGRITNVGHFNSYVYIDESLVFDTLSDVQYNYFNKLFECIITDSFNIVEHEISIDIDVMDRNDKQSILGMLDKSKNLKYSSDAKYVIVDSLESFVIKMANSNIVVQDMQPSSYKDDYFKEVLYSLLEIESVIKNNFDSEEINVNFQIHNNKNTIKKSEKLHFTITNDSEKIVFLYMFEMSPNYKIKRLLDHQKLPGYGNAGINATWSAPELEGDYIFLVIASDERINLNNLNMLSQQTSKRGYKFPQVDWFRRVVSVE